VDLFQFQHVGSRFTRIATSGDRGRRGKRTGALQRQKQLPSITDSKETERQGQRQQRGFLWIREARTRVLGESP
jgi:hypothetical protein